MAALEVDPDRRYDAGEAGSVSTGVLETESKSWCWACPSLPEGHPDREHCPCRMHRPTPAMHVLLEPIPLEDLRVQAAMLSGQLRTCQLEIRRCTGDARLEEPYDRNGALELRADGELFGYWAAKIQEKLRHVQAQLTATTVDVTNPKPAPAVRAVAGKRAASPRTKPTRAARTSVPTASKASTPVSAAQATGPSDGGDGPGSPEPPTPCSDSAPPAPPLPPPAAAATGLLSDGKRKLLERTLGIWQARTTRKLSLEDAREIVENATGAVELLHAWAIRGAGSKPGADTRAEAPGTDPASGRAS